MIGVLRLFSIIILSTAELPAIVFPHGKCTESNNLI
jgi:hypothetical protein